MDQRLVDRVAVITGGASGIGAASAEKLLAHGAKVVIGDIQDGPGEAYAEKLGPNAIYRHCDVTKEDEVEALINAAVEHFGRIDIMFNNAGIVGAIGPMDTCSPR